MLIEVGRENARGVTDLLRGFGYSLYDGTQALAGQQTSELCPEETLAIP